MKKIYTYLSFAIVMLASCTVTNYPQSYTSEPQDITYQQFYDDLSPYGQWVNYSNYGYVWIPDEQGFRPYYNNGHWVYTDYGWTWVSGYNWGWAPFHYGRWTYDYAYGWMWIPGYQWAPAWVSWRSGGDYYGWAPLGPDMNINGGYGSNIPYDYWSFVPSRYITSPRINNYYVNRQQNVSIINNTTIINNTRVINNNDVYITGPSAADVERNTREKINAVKIVQRNKPGGAEVTGDRVSLYRPVVKESPQQNQNWKPSKVGNLDDLKGHNRDNTQPVRDDSRKELNPTDRILPDVNTEKNNPPPLIIHKREIGQPQKTNNNQTGQPNNPPNIKKDNTTPDNERLNRGNYNQQRTEKTNNNPPVDKPQPIQENTDKKNDQPNTRRFQNQNNNPQPPVQNNPPAKDRNTNQPNNNPVNKPAIKPQFNNVRPQNNAQQEQKNKPVNQPRLNNQAPIIRNIKPADIKQPGQDNNQQKEKKE